MALKICIDFDGVIHNYASGWQGIDVIPDDPVVGAKIWLESLINDPQIEPIIYSARSSELKGIEAMKKYIEHRLAIPASQLVFADKKPPAFLTVDDRAVCFNGYFPSILAIKNFKPWNRKGSGYKNLTEFYYTTGQLLGLTLSMENYLIESELMPVELVGELKKVLRKIRVHALVS